MSQKQISLHVQFRYEYYVLIVFEEIKYELIS